MAAIISVATQPSNTHTIVKTISIGLGPALVSLGLELDSLDRGEVDIAELRGSDDTVVVSMRPVGVAMVGRNGASGELLVAITLLLILLLLITVV